MKKNKDYIKFLTYCAIEDEENLIRTTTKISNSNNWKLKLLSDERKEVSQAKIVNFALEQFFNNYFDDDELRYISEMKNAIDNYQDYDVNALISQLINIGRAFKGNEVKDIAKKNLELTLELASEILKYECESGDLLIAKDYFVNNLARFTTEKEKSIKELFEKNLTTQAIYELTEYILKDIANINQTKYEFALRNIEVAYRDFFKVKNNNEVNGITQNYIYLIRQNIPTVFKENIELKENLDILQKSFKQVLCNVEKLDYTNNDELEKIHMCLGSGNFQYVRQLLKTFGVNEKYSDEQLEKIYSNLNHLFFHSEKDKE